MTSTRLTHSHDATKTNQSTIIISNNTNTISSDLTYGQKKRGEGGRTLKNRRMEVAPVVHNATDTNTKDTKEEAPFDAKAILPESKAVKSISQLLESMRKSESRSMPFECIDGSSRTFPASHDVNRSIASTSTHSEPPSTTQALPKLETSVSRTGFRAFGIEAYPTLALKDELCFSFVTINRCSKANYCPGIHPYDRVFYRYLAFEQKQLRELRKAQASSPSPENTPVPDAEPMMMTALTDPVSLQPPIPESQPKTKAKTKQRRKKGGPSANTEINRTSVIDLTGDLQQSPVPPAENKNHTVSESTSGDDVHTWGDTFHNSRWSDTSSISEDLNVPGRWDPETGFWENFSDLKAWSSDSDATTDDMQTSPEGTGGQIPLSVPESTPQVLPVKEQKHPFPKYNERCRRWLWGECNLDYQCKFVHEDLEYDDPPEQPERNIESFPITLHDHIKFKLRSGFDVEDIITGFESPWIFMSNLPNFISDNALLKLLRPFGEVLEIRRPSILTSPLTLKVHFANPHDAYRAFTSLHGKTEFGCRLDLRMGLNLDNKGTLMKDSCVRIDWDAPHRTWYAGYGSRKLAEQALRVMKNTPYNDFLPTGTLHTMLPSVGVATVKMKFLPVDVDEQGLEIFGPLEGLMSERPKYQGYSAQDTIDGVRRLLSRFESTLVDFEVRPPPYREAKMRAWAYFMTPADAKAAAENLHCRKPQFTGYSRIYAQHIKTITFKVSVVKFQRAAASIHSLAETIWRQRGGNTLSVLDKHTHFSLQLCGRDLKVLGRWKAEVEKVLNGEAVLLKDGKTAWEEFFRRSLGIAFLQDLERAHAGVSIETDTTRRKIRLFGVAEKRFVVREKILEKINQLRLQKSCFIPLEGRLLAAFVNGELAALREKLVSEHIILDFGGHALRLRGDESVFNIAKDAVELVRKKYKIRRNKPIAVECPVCFDEASSPIKLNCGHSWCQACLHNYLTAASEQKFFPLTCLGNEGKCPERISLYAAKEVLSAADFDATVSAAFDTYVQTHPDELHYCPTPDCSQVFRPAPEGISLQCPSCLVRICPACNAEAHDGLTCVEFKDGDNLFDEWADQRDVKRCPGCNMAIEKDEGCNHMKCTMCQTHICWMCMKTFPGGDGIYRHMSSEHGGFGLGPIA